MNGILFKLRTEGARIPYWLTQERTEEHCHGFSQKEHYAKVFMAKDYSEAAAMAKKFRDDIVNSHPQSICLKGLIPVRVGSTNDTTQLDAEWDNC